MKKELIMTKFESANFEYHGGYLHYTNAAGERKFVARFKHRGPVTKAKFVKTLIKHYSVESYFGRLAGAYNAQGEAPLQILMNDDILVFDRDDLGRGRFILDGKVI
jgi:hypothetical protein